MFELIKDHIKDIKKIVFVTGAGISQESGIPTFRGKDGLWRNYDPMKLANVIMSLVGYSEISQMAKLEPIQVG